MAIDRRDWSAMSVPRATNRWATDVDGRECDEKLRTNDVAAALTLTGSTVSVYAQQGSRFQRVTTTLRVRPACLPPEYPVYFHTRCSLSSRREPALERGDGQAHESRVFTCTV